MMHQCFHGCYQWLTSGKKEIQSLDQEASIQLIKAVQTSCENNQVSSKKLHC